MTNPRGGESEPIASHRAALLAMDIQNGIVAAYGNDQGLLERVGAAAEHARSAGMSVVFVTVGLGRPPAVGRHNKIFHRYADSGALSEGTDATAVHAAAGVQNGDFLVVKRRVSAFSGSELDVLLRSRDINTLVLAGIATSGVVLSTLRQAADLDYRLFVLSDCCKDNDPDVHRVLMDKVFPRQAAILTLEEFRNYPMV